MLLHILSQAPVDSRLLMLQPCASDLELGSIRPHIALGSFADAEALHALLQAAAIPCPDVQTAQIAPNPACCRHILLAESCSPCRLLRATQPVSRRGAVAISSPIADWAGAQLRCSLLDPPQAQGFLPIMQCITAAPTGHSSVGSAEATSNHEHRNLGHKASGAPSPALN